MWLRTMASMEHASGKPMAAALDVSKRAGHVPTMAATAGSGTKSTSPRSPPCRASANVGTCSVDVVYVPCARQAAAAAA